MYLSQTPAQLAYCPPAALANTPCVVENTVQNNLNHHNRDINQSLTVILTLKQSLNP